MTPDEETISRFHRLSALRAGTRGEITVLDLYAGGGSIPFEAARYGCDTVANELNPVAATILQATIDLPADLADIQQSHLDWGTKWADHTASV